MLIDSPRLQSAMLSPIGIPLSDAHVLISEQSASSDSTIDFTTGIDSTYAVHIIEYTGVHPSSDSVEFGFQVNAVGASGFNEVIQSSYVEAYHGEGGGTALVYDTLYDQKLGTAYQTLGDLVGSDSDQSVSGALVIFGLADTTFAKQFLSEVNTSHGSNYSTHNRSSGYVNIAAAIDEISFKFSAGNIDSGEFKLFGVAKL